jgi:hypothetical protein
LQKSVKCCKVKGPGGCTLDRPTPADRSRQMPQDLPSPELLRKLLRYEPDTGKLFWRKRTPEMFSSDRHCVSWNARLSGKEALGSDNGMGYKQGGIFNRKYFAHRVIWAIVYGYWPDQIDHKNGIRHDNRIENLRSVPQHDNLKNKKKPVNNTSGVVGVCWSKKDGKWKAQIQHNKINNNLGMFDRFEDAVSARQQAQSNLEFYENHGR